MDLGRAAHHQWDAALIGALRAAGPPLLFGLRLWASVCLALYIAFWLELDNAYWAGTSAAIVCQPQLGASLRKGWYRMMGEFFAVQNRPTCRSCSRAASGSPSISKPPRPWV